jgi:hypothetical protein
VVREPPLRGVRHGVVPFVVSTLITNICCCLKCDKCIFWVPISPFFAKWARVPSKALVCKTALIEPPFLELIQIYKVSPRIYRGMTGYGLSHPGDCRCIWRLSYIRLEYCRKRDYTARYCGLLRFLNLKM